MLLLSTSPRVAPGCLTKAAWDALQRSTVCCGEADHPQLAALAAAGIDVEVLTGSSPAELVAEVRARATPSRPALWLAAPDGDAEFGAALALAVAHDGEEVELIAGSFDVPGARLLDAVAVMDRLRSPGGCPWDAAQTHASLAQYLLEEAYETVEAIETGDGAALREELGDLLLQVLFHARIAMEGLEGLEGMEGEPPADGMDGSDGEDGMGGAGLATGEPRWGIDEVAAGLVDKLIGRHPHVFGDGTAGGPAELDRTWEQLKRAEKQRNSLTDGVPLAQPGLAQAAKLHKRATDAGVPPELMSPLLGSAETTAAAVAAAVAGLAEQAGDSVDAMGELLFAVVALAREHRIDPEAALRGAVRRFRDRVTAVEDAGRAAGLDPQHLPAGAWREQWERIGRP